MRTAIISDIHGNLAGLQAALSDIALQRCERILCLGDCVDGGSQSIEVVTLLRSLSIPTVRGNHDEHPNDYLPPDIRHYLARLPESFAEGDVLYTHTSPRRKQNKISDQFEAWNVFEETPYRLVFVGDVHVPLLFGALCAEKASATSYEITYEQTVQFAENDRYIICVGAVGYSRDSYSLIRYAIYDEQENTLLFRALKGPLLDF